MILPLNRSKLNNNSVPKLLTQSKKLNKEDRGGGSGGGVGKIFEKKISGEGGRLLGTPREYLTYLCELTGAK